MRSRLCLSASGVALLVLTLGTAPHAETQPSADFERRIALFNRYLDPLRTQAGIPGLSAAVVSGRRVVWEIGLGYADVERRIAAAPNTPYRIASLTKTFASTLLLQCVERGTLDLDQPIARSA